MNTITLETPRLQIDFHSENGGILCVQQKRTGKQWCSTAGLLNVHCWSVGEERCCEISSQAPHVKLERLSERNSGFSALFQCHRTGWRMAVDLSARDDKIDIKIPFNRIREQDWERFRLMSVDVLPGFCAGARDDSGYMILPNFCGVKSIYGHGSKGVYRSRVYMDQSRWEDWCTFPFFGAVDVKTQSGVYGQVLDGEFDADVVAQRSFRDTHTDTVYPSFHYRHAKIDAIDPIDRHARFVFLANDQASYCGIAAEYRRFLLDEQRVKPFKMRIPQEPELEYELQAHSFKVFHAMKSRRNDGHGRLAAFTTFDEAAKVISRIAKAGIDKASYQLTGWNPEGHDGMWPTRFPMDAALGGNAGFERLRRRARALGHRIGFHDNYVDAYRTAPDWNEKTVMQDRDGELIRGGVWGGGLSFLLCMNESLDLNRKGLKAMKALGVDGIFYMDAIPRVLRACFGAEHSHRHTRRAEAEGTRLLLRMAREIMAPCPLGTENAMGYTMGLVDYAAHITSYVPDAAKKSVLLDEFVDDLVPAIPIAVHGLLKYHLGDLCGFEHCFGSLERGILKAAEFGATPRFEWAYRDKYTNDPGYLHMKTFSGEFEQACVRQYQLLSKQLGHLQLEFISGHAESVPGVLHTSYTNGQTVTVDYNSLQCRLE